MTQETLNSVITLNDKRFYLMRRLKSIEETMKDFHALYGENNDKTSKCKLKYLIETIEDHTYDDSNNLYDKLLLMAKEWIEQYIVQLKESISEINKQIEML